MAGAGKLHEPAVLERQVRRMLADNRSQALVSNFASQWLHLRNLASITPDMRLFPDFDDNLRQAFRQETELFFESILREDRSAIDLLRANYTFVNERLAKHYGIPHVYGSRFRRVALDEDGERGGLLRHASILTLTSYATRTSPACEGNGSSIIFSACLPRRRCRMCLRSSTRPSTAISRFASDWPSI